MGKRSAIFVDRDDTLMVDVKYCRDPSMVKLMPWAAEGLRRFSEVGYKVVIITNQSGLGRGYFTKSELDLVNARLRDELQKHGADYDALYYCPHRPDENCNCRKPRPGLVLRAASELDLNLRTSLTIGDREIDIEAGRAAGTRTILLGDGDSHKTKRSGETGPDFVAKNLVLAAGLIISERVLCHGTGSRKKE